MLNTFFYIILSMFFETSNIKVYLSFSYLFSNLPLMKYIGIPVRRTTLYIKRIFYIILSVFWSHWYWFIFVIFIYLFIVQHFTNNQNLNLNGAICVMTTIIVHLWSVMATLFYLCMLSWVHKLILQFCAKKSYSRIN